MGKRTILIALLVPVLAGCTAFEPAPTPPTIATPTIVPVTYSPPSATPDLNSVSALNCEEPTQKVWDWINRARLYRDEGAVMVEVGEGLNKGERWWVVAHGGYGNMLTNAPGGGDTWISIGTVHAMNWKGVKWEGDRLLIGQQAQKKAASCMAQIATPDLDSASLLKCEEPTAEVLAWPDRAAPYRGRGHAIMVEVGEGFNKGERWWVVAYGENVDAMTNVPGGGDTWIPIGTADYPDWQNIRWTGERLSTGKIAQKKAYSCLAELTQIPTGDGGATSPGSSASLESECVPADEATLDAITVRIGGAKAYRAFVVSVDEQREVVSFTYGNTNSGPSVYLRKAGTLDAMRWEVLGYQPMASSIVHDDPIVQEAARIAWPCAMGG